ncbi:uncharacterized protein LOC113467146 [Diaphorina citri]|uniref:Uncharacterized protein LOC113467146 n=1 Tax=Diaphorina citri TaxID=121845 RepID=A0A3Q0IX32_DIACI|nr:uncharacterized protein LOC113467146 [Diaphorina citri]
MPGWAGLGGVRYVPPAWGATDTDQAKAELNRLNIQVVRTLRTSDAAFSLGEGTDGLACVRFGMVTAETDITELLSLRDSYRTSLVSLEARGPVLIEINFEKLFS